MNNRQRLTLGTLGLSLLVMGGCSSKGGVSETVTTPAPAMQTASRTHIVQRGDTLYAIARRNGMDWNALARMNGISAPYVIKVGQRLQLPGGSQSYTPTVVTHPVQSTPVHSTPVVVSSQGAGVTAPPVSGSAAPAVLQSQPASQFLGTEPVTQWVWPADGTVIRTFDPEQTANPSKGIDITGQLGQPVNAAAAGQVVYAGSGLQGYGQLLLIRHNKSLVTAYGHNQRLLVQEGQTVRAGEKIAEMGSSGTDRVKLHFEVRKDGKPSDPLEVLPRN